MLVNYNVGRANIFALPTLLEMSGAYAKGLIVAVWCGALSRSISRPCGMLRVELAKLAR
jgi:hypothetical protein